MTTSKKIGILTCMSREWIFPKSLQEGGSSLPQAMGGQSNQNMLGSSQQSGSSRRLILTCRLIFWSLVVCSVPCRTTASWELADTPPPNAGAAAWHPETIYRDVDCSPTYNDKRRPK